MEQDVVRLMMKRGHHPHQLPGISHNTDGQIIFTPINRHNRNLSRTLSATSTMEY